MRTLSSTMTEEPIKVGEKPFRILCVSDLHARMSWMDWLLAVASHYDCVSIAGDITDLNIPMEFAHGQKMKNYLNSFRCPVIFSEGNHESWATGWWDGFCSVPTSEHVILPNSSRQFGLLCFVPFLYCQDKFAIPKTTAPQFWVVHEPPCEGMTGWTGREYYCKQPSSVDLLRGKHQPLFYHCGHIHQAPWLGGAWHEHMGNTWVLNPGSYANYEPGWHVSIPPHIEIKYYNPQTFQLTWRDPLNGHFDYISIMDWEGYP